MKLYNKCHKTFIAKIKLNKSKVGKVYTYTKFIKVYPKNLHLFPVEKNQDYI